MRILAVLAALLTGSATHAAEAAHTSAFESAVTGLWQLLSIDLERAPAPEIVAEAFRQCGSPENIGRILASPGKLQPRDLLAIPGTVAFLERGDRLYRIDLIRMKAVEIGAAEAPVVKGRGNVWTVRAGPGWMKAYLQERTIAKRKVTMLADATGLYLRCPSVVPSSKKDDAES